MEANKEKNAPLLPVPQFRDWDQKEVMPELTKDFSKIISLGKEEELISNTTRITNTYDQNFHDHQNQSPIEGLAEEVKDHEEGETKCGLCGKNYTTDTFWICCDFCEKWYHGQRVEITSAMAWNMKLYKCKICCTNKKSASA